MNNRENASIGRMQKAATVIGLALILALAGCLGGSSRGSNSNATSKVTSTFTSISISPSSPSIALGLTLQLRATGTHADGTQQDVTQSAAWTSSDPTKATIQTGGHLKSGLVTALADGSLIVTATDEGVSGSVTLTVTGSRPPIASISVNPLNASIIVGKTQQYKATATYINSTTQDITESANWTSVDPSTVAIQSSSGAKPGMATAIATGSVTITASADGVSGNVTLTVTDVSQLFSAPPMMDMPNGSGSCLTYKRFPGGLYENCLDTVPADHDSDGKNIAAQIQPLDLSGKPSANGKIALTSIGMSAAAQEFAAFVSTVNGNRAVNQTTLEVINGAASNMDACYWFPAVGAPACDSSVSNNYDRVETALTNNGVSPLQVQAVWIKEANGRIHPQATGCSPAGTDCVPLCDEGIGGCSNTVETTDAISLEQELGNILRAAKQRWPNLKVAFFTSRLYGGYAPAGAGDPEPFAYESGYAVKWLVQAQINQLRGMAIDPVAGDLGYNVSPWIAWGPYFWADGPIPRSDGLVWCDGTLSPNPPCNGEVDFALDGEHPKTTTKQVNLLMSFFLNSPYTSGWFAAH